MKHIIFILTVIVLFVGCKPKTMEDYMEDLREGFAIGAEEHNKKVYAWEERIETLYKRADIDLQNGVEYADSLIKNDITLDKWKVSGLNTIIGELYYDNDSFELAIGRFYQNEILTFDSPKNKANKAGCYIKFGDIEKAMVLLEQAAETNYDYKWYIGNLYEIKGEPEKAILEYDYVYQRDTIVYAYYNQRIKELKKNSDQLFTELLFKDRRKRVYLLLQGVNNN